MEIKNQDRQDVGLNSTGELNLYLDLLAFSEMSSDEQPADKERPEVVSSEEILEAAVGFPEHVEADDYPEDVLSPDESSEPILEFPPATEQPLTIEADLETLPSEEAEPHAAPAAPGDLFRASGPLSITGFLFDPASKAAPQAASLAVCASCGSEAEGEDLFCVACGDFMDEKADTDIDTDTGTEMNVSACDDCGLIITTDELFCPACGTASAVC